MSTKIMVNWESNFLSQLEGHVAVHQHGRGTLSHHYPLTDPLGGGGVKNVSYNNFFLIYAIYIVRF